MQGFYRATATGYFLGKSVMCYSYEYSIVVCVEQNSSAFVSWNYFLLLAKCHKLFLLLTNRFAVPAPRVNHPAPFLIRIQGSRSQAPISWLEYGAHSVAASLSMAALCAEVVSAATPPCVCPARRAQAFFLMHFI